MSGEPVNGDALAGRTVRRLDVGNGIYVAVPAPETAEPDGGAAAEAPPDTEPDGAAAAAPPPDTEPLSARAEATARRWSVPMIAAPFAAGAALVAAIRLGGTADGVLAAGVLALLVVLAAIDLRARLIPNSIVLPGLAAVIAFQVAFGHAHTFEWLAAAVGAPLVMLVPALVHRDGMGMGDVKLVALLGAALGAAVVPALMVAFLAVLPVAVTLLVRGGAAARRTAIPFAPFMALGAAVVLLS